MSLTSSVPSILAGLAEGSWADALDRDGYVVIDLLDADAVAAASRALADVGTAPDDGCLGRISSADSRDARYRSLAAAAARRVLAGLTSVIDPGFVVAWPGDLSGTGLHHELPPPGDLARPRLHVEVALDAAAVDNGQTWVVPGSHRWFDAPTAAPVDSDVAERVATRHAAPVSLRPGQALVAADALLRFTLPNRDRPRRSVTCWLPAHPGPAPHEGSVGPVSRARLARLELDGWAPDREPTPHEAPNAGILRCAACGSRLPGGGGVEPWNGVVTGRCARCSVGPVSGILERGDPPTPSPALDFPLPERPTAVLADPSLDHRLRTDGFVVFPEPVITPDQAHRLRNAFGDLHQWEGFGHLNDFNQRDRPYRNEATRLMKEHLLGILSPLFTDHDPFLCTFLCKWPDDGSDLEPHQDWMYVDERRGERTFLAFVALDDITGDRGRIRVLRGSHRLDSMPRGTDLRPGWLGHAEVLERRLESIPMTVGQCAIWSSALVHSSLPNLTDEPRVAAGLWFVRRGEPLVHFRRLDHATAGLFEIDGDFYRTQNPYRLMVSNPPYPLCEVVPTDGQDLTPEALERNLDRILG